MLNLDLDTRRYKRVSNYTPAQLRAFRKREQKRVADDLRWRKKVGCTCWPYSGGWDTDPRCPAHGLSEFRADNDRR